MIIDQKMNEIMKESLDLQGERLGNSYPTKRGSWGSLLDRFGQRFPLYLVRTYKKNSKQKLAGNAAKHTQNVKKFLFLHRIFFT
jgi:hypothetical protein